MNSLLSDLHQQTSNWTLGGDTYMYTHSYVITEQQSELPLLQDPSDRTVMALCFLQAALLRKHSLWYVSPLEPQTGTYFLEHCKYGDINVKKTRI